jgi:hypothetical protein
MIIKHKRVIFILFGDSGSDFIPERKDVKFDRKFY